MCIYFYIFKLQSPSKYSPVDAKHLIKTFFPLLETVFELVNFCSSFCAASVFLFHCLHISKSLPFEDFSSRETKKSHSGQDQVNGQGEAHGSCWFLSKTGQHLWAGMPINHPSWNGHMHWKNLQKMSLKWNTASHNNASWYTDTDGFLEHPPSGGSLYYSRPTLQKITPAIFRFPSYIKILRRCTLTYLG